MNDANDVKSNQKIEDGRISEDASAVKKHPILLVDDEPEILFSLKGLLRREFELYSAESGQEALEILKTHPIHVVMTDQRMPQMTGAELMSRVRVEHPDAVRIIFTGYADLKAVIEAVNDGGIHRYVTKPWDPDELIDMLREAAEAYARIVERKRLLLDVRRHVETGRSLIGGTFHEGGNVEAEDYVATAEKLLRRIDALIQES